LASLPVRLARTYGIAAFAAFRALSPDKKGRHGCDLP
jgi:hypothetical protein